MTTHETTQGRAIFPITPPYDGEDACFCGGLTKYCASHHHAPQQTASYQKFDRATATSAGVHQDPATYGQQKFGANYQQYSQPLEQEKQGDNGHQTQAANEAQPDKPVGGVAAVLNYNNDTMARFITICAHGIFAHTDRVLHDEVSREHVANQGGIDKFDILGSLYPHILTAAATPECSRFTDTVEQISQVLKSVRLPLESILLSVYFLAERVGRVRMREEDVKASMIYPYTIVSMVLASKVHDDNTFYNKSWSDVSHLKLLSLNKWEREWLAEMRYELFPLDKRLQDACRWHRLYIDYEAMFENRDPRAEKSWDGSGDVVSRSSVGPVVHTTLMRDSLFAYYPPDCQLTPPHSASSQSAYFSSIWPSHIRDVKTSTQSQDTRSQIGSLHNSSRGSPASSDRDGRHTPPFTNVPRTSASQVWISTDGFNAPHGLPYPNYPDPAYMRNYMAAMGSGIGTCARNAYPVRMYGNPASRYISVGW